MNILVTIIEDNY